MTLTFELKQGEGWRKIKLEHEDPEMLMRYLCGFLGVDFPTTVRRLKMPLENS